MLEIHSVIDPHLYNQLKGLILGGPLPEGLTSSQATALRKVLQTKHMKQNELFYPGPLGHEMVLVLKFPCTLSHVFLFFTSETASEVKG